MAFSHPGRADRTFLLLEEAGGARYAQASRNRRFLLFFCGVHHDCRNRFLFTGLESELVVAGEQIELLESLRNPGLSTLEAVSIGVGLRRTLETPRR